ncbi:MAG: hypothetical protein R3F61_10010 [Myxococcota bacterium]
MWLIALLACSSAPENPCTDDAAVLVQEEGAELTCAGARVPTRYLRVLAGRPLPAGSTAVGVNAVKERFLENPEETLAWLDQMRAAAREIEVTPGVEGAEKRAHQVWLAITDSGPIRKSDAALWNILEPALSVYARDDEEKLALTEVDMEGWITYASLCHEVQGDGVLTLSIAQRVDIYRMIKDRFEQADRSEMAAMASLGAVWADIRDRWQAAPYERQQAWIQAAPLPDRQNGSSLAYIEAVLEGDLHGHAATMHAHFGPLHFRDGPGYFIGEP